MIQKCSYLRTECAYFNFYRFLVSKMKPLKLFRKQALEYGPAVIKTNKKFPLARTQHSEEQQKTTLDYCRHYGQI